MGWGGGILLPWQVLPMARPRHLPSPLLESKVPLLRMPPCARQSTKLSVLPRCDLQPCYPTRPCRASCPGPPQAVPLLQRGRGGQARRRGPHRSLGIWLLLVCRGGAVLPRPLPSRSGEQASCMEGDISDLFIFSRSVAAGGTRVRTGRAGPDPQLPTHPEGMCRVGTCQGVFDAHCHGWECGSESAGMGRFPGDARASRGEEWSVSNK